jgi:predicted DNA-binding ribbon-helix-helix protein
MLSPSFQRRNGVNASRLINRNVTALRGRTSMRLEPELWTALVEICRREGITMGEMVQRIEAIGHPGGRTSAVRVHVLTYFREAATEEGHRAAGHKTAEHDAGAPAHVFWPTSQPLSEAGSVIWEDATSSAGPV